MVFNRRFSSLLTGNYISFVVSNPVVSIVSLFSFLSMLLVPPSNSSRFDDNDRLSSLENEFTSELHRQLVSSYPSLYKSKLNITNNTIAFNITNLDIFDDDTVDQRSKSNIFIYKGQWTVSADNQHKMDPEFKFNQCLVHSNDDKQSTINCINGRRRFKMLALWFRIRRQQNWIKVDLNNLNLSWLYYNVNDIKQLGVMSLSHFRRSNLYEIDYSFQPYLSVLKEEPFDELNKKNILETNTRQKRFVLDSELKFNRNIKVVQCSGKCCMYNIAFDFNRIKHWFSRFGFELLFIDGSTMVYHYRFCSGFCGDLVRHTTNPSKSCCHPNGPLAITEIDLKRHNVVTKLFVRLNVKKCQCSNGVSYHQRTE
ncbi:hypothetical protein GJ496_009918 [Pomphorhynchus laevis]|nr:hypothetical protein GJ496_009918 [Pomphorhynchus laevis]